MAAPIPIADMRVRMDTNGYIGPQVLFPPDVLRAETIQQEDGGPGLKFKLDGSGIRSVGIIGCAEDNVDPGSSQTWFDFEGFRSPSFILVNSVAQSTTPATTGSQALVLDGLLTRILTIVPTGDCSFNIDDPPDAVAGARLIFIVTTSGTSSRTLTFATGFISAGTLATGTVTAKTFTIEFVCRGDNVWVELHRTGAM